MPITISAEEIEEFSVRFPGSPTLAQDPTARETWLRWRIILERIINSEGYNATDPRRFSLLKLSTFAVQMLGAANTLAYRDSHRAAGIRTS